MSLQILAVHRALLREPRLHQRTVYSIVVDPILVACVIGWVAERISASSKFDDNSTGNSASLCAVNSQSGSSKTMDNIAEVSTYAIEEIAGVLTMQSYSRSARNRANPPGTRATGRKGLLGP